MADILFPFLPHTVEYFQQQSAYQPKLEKLYFEWHEAKQQTQPFVIENIRFEHDPEWRTRLFSIQSVRDAGTGGGHQVWRVTWQLMRVLRMGVAV